MVVVLCKVVLITYVVFQLFLFRLQIKSIQSTNVIDFDIYRRFLTCMVILRRSKYSQICQDVHKIKKYHKIINELFNKNVNICLMKINYMQYI